MKVLNIWFRRLQKILSNFWLSERTTGKLIKWIICCLLNILIKRTSKLTLDVSKYSLFDHFYGSFLNLNQTEICVALALTSQALPHKDKEAH